MTYSPGPLLHPRPSSQPLFQPISFMLVPFTQSIHYSSHFNCWTELSTTNLPVLTSFLPLMHPPSTATILNWYHPESLLIQSPSFPIVKIDHEIYLYHHVSPRRNITNTLERSAIHCSSSDLICDCFFEFCSVLDIV